MFKRILVPLDGSRASAKALPYAIEIAQRFGAELILLQAVSVTPSPMLTVPAGVGISSVATQMAQEAALAEEKRGIARARRYLSDKLRLVTSRGVTGSFHVVTGTPANSILEFCKKEKVALVVMTTSGKSGIKRALLGSVADQLIRDSTVPELVIRPEMKRKSKK